MPRRSSAWAARELAALSASHNADGARGLYVRRARDDTQSERLHALFHSTSADVAAASHVRRRP